MSSEDLPNEFDIIILGTGLTASIAAAAFSRIGLKILHLDRNDYYGGAYANFNLDQIEDWKQRNQRLGTNNEIKTGDEPESLPSSISDDVTCIKLPQESARAFNLTSKFHVRERTAEEEAEAKKAQSSSTPFFKRVEVTSFSTDPADTSREENTTEETPDTTAAIDTEAKLSDEVPEGPAENSPDSFQSGNSDGINPEVPERGEHLLTHDVSKEDAEGQQTSVEGKGCCEVPTVHGGALEESPLTNEATDLSETKEDQGEPSSVTQDDSLSETASSEASPEKPASEEKKKDWTVGGIKDEWRRYCFDLSPRILHCCGDMIELLIRSDVARYCEFRTVSRVITLLKDKLEPVPCSRADVFSSKIVSLIEKRLMMKFLQFAADFENHPQEYEGHEDSTFVEFLKSKKLTANLQHFVQHAIAMASDSCNVIEGLAKTKKFLQSLGRYGNTTAFLFPLYGTGELPQAFSRLSAVFGGIYCLTETATHMLSDTEAKCCGIITSKEQKVSCKYLVAESSYLPSTHVQRLSLGKVSRGIYITDGSINSTSAEDLTLLNFLCKDDTTRPVTVLEMPSTACVCPKGVYVVYFTRPSDSDDPEEDLQEVRERLFAPESCDPEETRPHVLWSMHFTMEDWSRVSLTDKALGRVLVASGGGDNGIDVDFCVSEARNIFHAVCPDEEFLPTPPNPEDIIHGEEEDNVNVVDAGEAGDADGGWTSDNKEGAEKQENLDGESTDKPDDKEEVAEGAHEESDNSEKSSSSAPVATTEESGQSALSSSTKPALGSISPVDQDREKEATENKS